MVFAFPPVDYVVMPGWTVTFPSNLLRTIACESLFFTTNDRFWTLTTFYAAIRFIMMNF